MSQTEKQAYLKKQMIVLFDGTGNREADSKVENGTGTSIARLKKMYTEMYVDAFGEKNGIGLAEANKHILYVAGPGTTEFGEAFGGDSPYLGLMDGIRDAALGGVTGNSVDERLEYATTKMEKMLSLLKEQDDINTDQIELTVSGFSRGGATALDFINRLDSKVWGQNKINALLFDPVASVGIPANNVNPGLTLTIPQKLENLRILSVVSNTEHRLTFPLSHVLPNGTTESTTYDGLKKFSSADGRVVEIEGLGAHSDVGGGYEDNDNLAKLNFMRSLNEFYGADGVAGKGMPLLSFDKMSQMSLPVTDTYTKGDMRGHVKQLITMQAPANQTTQYQVHDSSSSFPSKWFPLEGAVRLFHTAIDGHVGNELRNKFYQYKP